MYRYFVSFQFPEGGFGNQEVGRAVKIKNINDIKQLSRELETHLGLKENTLVIMNFQLFD